MEEKWCLDTLSSGWRQGPHMPTFQPQLWTSLAIFRGSSSSKPQPQGCAPHATRHTWPDGHLHRTETTMFHTVSHTHRLQGQKAVQLLGRTWPGDTHSRQLSLSSWAAERGEALRGRRKGLLPGSGRNPITLTGPYDSWNSVHIGRLYVPTLGTKFNATGFRGLCKRMIQSEKKGTVGTCHGAG